jgi:hypothetical protein
MCTALSETESEAGTDVSTIGQESEHRIDARCYIPCPFEQPRLYRSPADALLSGPAIKFGGPKKENLAGILPSVVMVIEKARG